MKKICIVCCAVLFVGMSLSGKAALEKTTHRPHLLTEGQRISALRVVFQKFAVYGNGIDIFNELIRRGLLKQKYPVKTLIFVWRLYYKKYKRCSYRQFLKMFELKEK